MTSSMHRVTIKDLFIIQFSHLFALEYSSDIEKFYAHLSMFIIYIRSHTHTHTHSYAQINIHDKKKKIFFLQETETLCNPFLFRHFFCGVINSYKN